jgi:hypothetical protein
MWANQGLMVKCIMKRAKAAMGAKSLRDNSKRSQNGSFQSQNRTMGQFYDRVLKYWRHGIMPIALVKSKINYTVDGEKRNYISASARSQQWKYSKSN